MWCHLSGGGHRRDYPNLGLCGGLLAQILLCSSCCKTDTWQEAVKVGASTQRFLWALPLSTRDSLVKQIVTRGRQFTKVVVWASLGTVDPLPTFRPWDEYGFKGFPSQIVETIHRISRTSLLVQTKVFLTMLEHLANIIGPGSGLLAGETWLPPPPCLGLLFILPKC